MRSEIRLNRELSMADALLDLAHELTHFVQREIFNPYSLQFSALQFLEESIEGQGGEAQAYISECKVAEGTPFSLQWNRYKM